MRAEREFFHGYNGTCLGASHQTGWTALVALLFQYESALRIPSPGPFPRLAAEVPA